MKKYLLYISIFATLAFLSGCENTNENLVQERGVDIALPAFEAAPAFFTEDLASSYVAFDLVELPEGTTIDKTEIEVVYNGQSIIFREISLPTEVRVTAYELIAAFELSPDDIKVGDVFFLYILITKEGRATRSPAAMQIPVTCDFNADLTSGIYNFSSADWEVSGKVTIEVDPEDPYKLFILDYAKAEGSGNATGERIELNINPNTFNISGPKATIAENMAHFEVPSYTNYSFEPIEGTYNSCEGSYTVTFAITVDQGSFGSYAFTFTREQ